MSARVDVMSAGSHLSRSRADHGGPCGRGRRVRFRRPLPTGHPERRRRTRGRPPGEAGVVRGRPGGGGHGPAVRVRALALAVLAAALATLAVATAVRDPEAGPPP